MDLEADAAIEAPFDTWLRDHIADVLQFPGFLSAEVLADTRERAGQDPAHRALPPERPGRARRLPSRPCVPHARYRHHAVRRAGFRAAAVDGATGRVHPRQGFHGELSQLRRGADGPALLPLRPARDGPGAVDVGNAPRPARRHHELRLAVLADAVAARVPAGRAYPGLSAWTAGELHAAVSHVPDPERRVLPARDAGRQSGQRPHVQRRRERRGESSAEPRRRREGCGQGREAGDEG